MLRYQMNITHLTICARSALAFLVLTKTPINRIFFGNLITTYYGLIYLNSKKSTVFRKCDICLQSFMSP